MNAKIVPVAWLLLALSVLPASAYAVELTPEGCEVLASVVHSAAVMRDLDANLQKHLAMIDAADMPAEFKELVKGEVAKVYKSKAKPGELYENTLARCFAAQGKVGKDS